MKKPVLVIMAAGMGSRFGGIKQIEPVSDNGNIIIDYSIYDAYKSGFRDVIFIIKEELADIFDEVIGNKVRKFMNVSYVFQDIEKFTNGKVSKERIKPLGTGQAVLCTKEILDAPFAIINADDFYGRQSFELMYNFLEGKQQSQYEYAIVGYNIENTLSDSGYVTRGVCVEDENGHVIKIDERKKIKAIDSKIVYTNDEQTFVEIPRGTSVSMNMMGFTSEFLVELEREFCDFLEKELPLNPLTAEYLIPIIVDNLINEKKAKVQILKTCEKWYGITYKEDKETVKQAIYDIMKQGLYDGI